MGITIHYRFGIYNEESLERILKEMKKIAEKMNLDIMYFKLNQKKSLDNRP